VSAIIFCDLFTVAQDWEFPSFQKNINITSEVLIGGTFVTELHCDLLTRLVRRLPAIPKGIRKWLPRASFFTFQMSGAWLMYGPLLIVMGIDLFCTKTQVMYEPEDYGQYFRGGEDKGAWQVWTIRDEAYLAEAYSEGYLVKSDWVTFDARWNSTTGEPIGQSGMRDFELKSQHTGSMLRYLCPIPGLLAMVVFGFLLAYGNRRRVEVRRRIVQRSEEELESRPPTAGATSRDVEEEEKREEAAEPGASTPPLRLGSCPSLASLGREPSPEERPQPQPSSPAAAAAEVLPPRGLDMTGLSSPSPSAETVELSRALVPGLAPSSGNGDELPILPGQLGGGPSSNDVLGR